MNWQPQNNVGANGGGGMGEMGVGIAQNGASRPPATEYTLQGMFFRAYPSKVAG